MRWEGGQVWVWTGVRPVTGLYVARSRVGTHLGSSFPTLLLWKAKPAQEDGDLPVLAGLSLVNQFF